MKEKRVKKNIYIKIMYKEFRLKTLVKFEKIAVGKFL